MSRCIFERNHYVGRCKSEATDGAMCAEHAGTRCACCGALATRECNEHGMQFLCGAPLCPNCTVVHTDGGWSHRHVRRSEVTP